MAISFFAGLLFAPWRREALWVVSMALATLALLVAGKYFYPELSRSLLGSVIHLVLWPLVLWVLWRPGARNRRRHSGTQGYLRYAYSGWLSWVSALILISLVLDARYLLQHVAVS